MSNRGGRGRRTPTPLKLLSGNPGQRPVNTPPPLPAGPALADLALCLHRLREAEAIVEREGLVVQGRDGPKAHPATRLAKDYRQAAQAWAARFGLTPHARGSLDVKPAGVKDPLEELLETR